YGELAARAGRLAGYLRGLGVGPESVVGLWRGRGGEVVVGVGAVGRAGGGERPVDPGLAGEGVAVVVADADGVRVVTASPVGGVGGRGGRGGGGGWRGGWRGGGGLMWSRWCRVIWGCWGSWWVMGRRPGRRGCWWWAGRR